MTYRPTVKLIHFGQGGHTLHLSTQDGTGRHEQQGYCTPENLFELYQWWADAPGVMSDHLKGFDLPDGTPAIDVSEAVKTTPGYRWVFRGPMVDVNLPDGERDELRTADVDPIMAQAMAGNTFGQLLALHGATKACSSEPGPLDSVSISEYLRGWRLRGARIGHTSGRSIVWHDESPPILPGTAAPAETQLSLIAVSLGNPAHDPETKTPAT